MENGITLFLRSITKIIKVTHVFPKQPKLISTKKQKKLKVKPHFANNNNLPTEWPGFGRLAGSSHGWLR